MQCCKLRFCVCPSWHEAGGQPERERETLRGLWPPQAEAEQWAQAQEEAAAATALSTAESACSKEAGAAEEGEEGACSSE